MKNILKIININIYTYLFIIICIISGYIKNIVIIYIICIFHELGHILYIKLFKYKVVSIEILPFGLYTNIDKLLNSSINKDIIISLGGILNQILLFIIIYIFKENINIITYNLLIKYNVIILLFNILPIIPLDGNNLLHLLLEKYYSYHNSYYINLYISIIFLIIFILINYLYKIDNYIIISFLIYKLIMYIKNYKYLRNRFLLERIIYDIQFKRINNNTKNINEIKKEVYHFFRNNNKYINEKEYIISYLNHEN